jgi:hypothetical protein
MSGIIFYTNSSIHIRRIAVFSNGLAFATLPLCQFFLLEFIGSILLLFVAFPMHPRPPQLRSIATLGDFFVTEPAALP